jgi:hypothetical protein
VVEGSASAAVLVVRIGAHTEALVVREGRAASDPVAAASLLERASAAAERPAGVEAVTEAVRQAAPFVRARMAALAAARWRAADRDGRARRLIPWVLNHARAAARARDRAQLAELDALVARLSGGLTAGEELLLDDLLASPVPLRVSALLEWMRRLPPDGDHPLAPVPRLLAAVVCVPDINPPGQDATS